MNVPIAYDDRGIATAPVLVACCAWCKRVRIAGVYMTVATAEANGSMPGWYEFTHGICPECKEEAQRSANRALSEMPMAA